MHEHEKEFRGVWFVLMLALGAFCAMLWTMTLNVDTTGGIALGFRVVVCAALTLAVLVLFALDLVGIWTGDWPHLHHHR